MMSRSAGGSCAGSTEPEVEGEVEGVGEAEDLAVRRWKETGEETVRRWGLDRRGLERRAEETRRRGVEVAAADAMVGGSGHGGEDGDWGIKVWVELFFGLFLENG